MVTWSRELSPLGRARDERVRSALEEARVEVRETAGDMVAEPDGPDRLFGRGLPGLHPFHRVWRDLPLPAHVPAPAKLTGPRLGGDGLDRLPGGDPPLPAGPAAARRAAGGVHRVGRGRRLPLAAATPAADATSHLSAYLRLGMCTGPQIGRALGLPGSLSAGREAFWRQICWREFYHHHLARHPEVLRVALRPDLRGVEWDDDPEDLRAWEAGETGFPFVNAGMRQLGADRVDPQPRPDGGRLVPGQGPAGQLAPRRDRSSCGPWWTATRPTTTAAGSGRRGTGTDAAPYFRVLNPVLQSKRFDPAGDYMRRYVPELRDVPDARIHEPWRMSAEEQRGGGCRIGSDYPAPRVDHRERRGPSARAVTGAARART